MIRKLAASLLALGALISGIFVTSDDINLGVALPSGPAVFETSLQDRISSTDTSMTLVANSVRGGSSLAGYQCFTIDEGRTDMEYVCGTVSGTSVTSLTRGVDPLTATTSNSAVKFAHRKGANVKVTDFPLIQRMRNQNNGVEAFENILYYGSDLTFTTDTQLVSKKYIDDLAFSGAGIIQALFSDDGVVELATQIEIASSTVTGESGAALVIPAQFATSTYNALTSPLRLVMTQNNGKIDPNFIPDLASSTVIGSFPAYHIGKNVQVITTTGTSTFNVPNGVTKLAVEVQAGGGAGGSCLNGASSNGATGGSGGAGGYAAEMVNVSGTSTIQLFVGAAGEPSKFGTNGEYLFATGGSAGAAEGAGGVGGTGSGGDVNVVGQGGAAGNGDDSDYGAMGSGSGGASRLGGGAAGVFGSNGIAGGVYGGGGSGASCAGNNNSASGGSGAQGVIIIRW